MWRTTHIGEHQTRKPKRKTLNITIVSKGKVAFVHLQKKFNSLPKILVRHPEVIALKYNISVNTYFFLFSRCWTYSASKYSPIDFAVLWGILHDRKYTHSLANGVHSVTIHCFTKGLHKSDNYFTLCIILASQRKKLVIFNP